MDVNCINVRWSEETVDGISQWLSMLPRATHSVGGVAQGTRVASPGEHLLTGGDHNLTHIKVAWWFKGSR